MKRMMARVRMVRPKGSIIKVRVQFEGPYWSAIFERHEKKIHATARQIFATEPSDEQLHDFVLHYFYELKFKQSVNTFTLDIHRTNGDKNVEPSLKPRSKKPRRLKSRPIKSRKKVSKKLKQKLKKTKLLSKKQSKTKP